MRRRTLIGPLLLAAGLASAAWMPDAAATQAPASPLPVSSPALASASGSADSTSAAAMETCRTCHEPQMAGMKGTSHLGLDRSCASCHGDVHAHLKSVTETGDPGPVASFKKMKPREVNAACLTCHDKGRQANWHGGMHDRRGVSCTSCHSVHAFLSPRAQLKTVREPEGCYSCHTQMRARSMRASHHPVIEGVMGCASCHDPHDGTRPKMLTAESVNEKCLQCHTEKRGPFLWEHAPARESCVLCHDPHGSNHDNLLVAKQPYLCQRCHLNTRHPGTLYDQRNTIGGASVSNRAIEHSCRNCHQNVHGGNAPSGPYLGR